MFRNANKEKGKRNTASLNGALLSPVKGRRHNTERKTDSINQVAAGVVNSHFYRCRNNVY